MRHASFHIHRTPDRRTWVVEEEGEGQLGGLFSTLAAALDYVDGEARRFEHARAVVELSRGG
jgi:hypothetical protein